jgi:hypothetical protein
MTIQDSQDSSVVLSKRYNAIRLDSADASEQHPNRYFPAIVRGVDA